MCCDKIVNVNGKKLLEEYEEGCSLTKRLKSFNDSHSWDIEFVIEETGVVYRVGAHRQVVARSSPVLEAMCCENLANANKTIEINDVTFDAFQVVLNFMYNSDYPVRSIETACRVLFAAKKYMMPRLAENCIDYVTSRFDVSNVCEIAEFSLEHELSDLLRECCVKIGQNATEVLAHPSFSRCSLNVISVVLNMDSLVVSSETEVSNACVHWAEVQCLKNGLQPSRDNLRSALGLALGKIRFLSMTALQLIESSSFERLLTDEEARTILVNIIKPRSCPLPPTICVDSRRRCQ